MTMSVILGGTMTMLTMGTPDFRRKEGLTMATRKTTGIIHEKIIIRTLRALMNSIPEILKEKKVDTPLIDVKTTRTFEIIMIETDQAKDKTGRRRAGNYNRIETLMPLQNVCCCAPCR